MTDNKNDLDLELDELDTLLGESNLLAEAKKKKASLRRLSPEQEQSLALARAMEEIASWEFQATIFHVKKTICTCGGVTTTLDGQFELLSHRRGGATRVQRVAGAPKSPCLTYVSRAEVGKCLNCQTRLWEGTIDTADHAIVTALGITDTDFLTAVNSPEPPVLRSAVASYSQIVSYSPPPEEPSYDRAALKAILIARDGMTAEEAEEMIVDAQERVMQGEDPEEILLDDFGLEPDYIFALM